MPGGRGGGGSSRPSGGMSRGGMSRPSSSPSPSRPSSSSWGGSSTRSTFKHATNAVRSVRVATPARAAEYRREARRVAQPQRRSDGGGFFQNTTATDVGDLLAEGMSAVADAVQGASYQSPMDYIPFYVDQQVLGDMDGDGDFDLVDVAIIGGALVFIAAVILGVVVLFNAVSSPNTSSAGSAGSSGQISQAPVSQEQSVVAQDGEPSGQRFEINEVWPWIDEDSCYESGGYDLCLVHDAYYDWEHEEFYLAEPPVYYGWFYVDWGTSPSTIYMDLVTYEMSDEEYYNLDIENCGPTSLWESVFWCTFYDAQESWFMVDGEIYVENGVEYWDPQYFVEVFPALAP